MNAACWSLSQRECVSTESVDSKQPNCSDNRQVNRCPANGYLSEQRAALHGFIVPVCVLQFDNELQ